MPSSAKGRIVPPPVGITGVIVATYAAVVMGSVVAYCTTRAKIALTFLAASVATIFITYIEQEIAIKVLGDQVGEYILHFNGNQKSVHAKAIGTAPLDRRLWEVPSAVCQLLAMGATFWSLFILDEYVADQKKEKKCMGRTGVVLRTGAVWAVAAAVMAYSARHGFVSPMQGIVGITLGSLTGWVFYVVATMYGTYATCRE